MTTETFSTVSNTIVTFLQGGKKQLSQFASETTKSLVTSYMQHTTSAIKALLIYMGIIEIIFNLM